MKNSDDDLTREGGGRGPAVLGEGVLCWARQERQSDRYGAVALLEGEDSCRAHALNHRDLEGTPGRLLAEGLETRPSPHVGDGWHRVGPATPERGEQVELGEGFLFFEEPAGHRAEDGGHTVGLRPPDGRKHLWLDVGALYRMHNQTVRLTFVPAAAGGRGVTWRGEGGRAAHPASRGRGPQVRSGHSLPF